jgi:hypothetical protein
MPPSPLSLKGEGELGVENGLNESAEVFWRDGRVRKADDEDVRLGGEVQCAYVVVEALGRVVVNGPIDREAELRAVEVKDVAANDLLTSELRSRKESCVRGFRRKESPTCRSRRACMRA